MEVSQKASLSRALGLLMKVGDAVCVETSNGTKFGVVVTHAKKRFMVGPVVDVLVEGVVMTILREKVQIIEGDINES